MKVRHFASKTIKIGFALEWESIITELFIVFLLGVFAFMGYAAKIALLLFPCGIAAVLCLFMTFQRAYIAAKDKIEPPHDHDQQK
jgi:hypothetical protein